MFAVSALIPSGSGSTLVLRVLAQANADAPELLAVLGGVVAISIIIHLLLRFIRRTREFDENYKFASKELDLEIDDAYEYAQAIEDGDYDYADELADRSPIEDGFDSDSDDGSAGVKRALGEFDTEYAKSEAMLDDLEAFNRRLRRGV